MVSLCRKQSCECVDLTHTGHRKLGQTFVNTCFPNFENNIYSPTLKNAQRTFNIS